MDATDKDVERQEQGGIGRGSRIGLAVIAVLAMIFVGVLIMKMSGSDDATVASDGEKKATTGAADTKPKPAPTATGWSGGNPTLPSYDEPVKVSPAPKKSRQGGPTQPSRWQSPPAGTSPEWTMMPKSDAGSSAVGDVSVPAAPSPSADLYQASRQPTAGGPAQPSGAPADAFAPQASQPAGTATANYPMQYPPPSQYQPGGSTYPEYPPNPSPSYPPAPAEPNPLRDPTGVSQYAPAGSSYPAGSSNSQQYTQNQQHQSGPSYQGGSTGYEPARYSEKTARPYTYRNDPPGPSSSETRHRYDLKSYRPHRHSDHIGPSPAGLGRLRDDGKYVVGPRENFAVISKKLYGTQAFFRALAEINREQYPDPHRLDVGDVIVAPQESELFDKYPDLCPSPEHRKVIESRVKSVSTSTNYRTGPTYTVQQGDTLFDIARYKLGDGSRWPEIYELNLDVLQGDFNYVDFGTVLTLPDDQPSDAVTQRPASRRRR